MDSAEHFARLLGAHAVAAFAVALALVLLAVLAAWLAFRRFDRRAGAHAASLAQRRLLLRLGIAGAMLAAAALVFAAMSEALDSRSAMARFDTALAASLREQLPPAVLQAFALLTFAGDRMARWALGVAVAALLLWRGQRTLALAWVVALAGTGTLNTLLKNLFERSRPAYLHGLDVGVHGWSFPSGHSSGAVVAYGMLAYLAQRLAPPRWRLPALLAATAVAFTTGSSRVFLQVHYASDVLAGFASGLAWLTLCVLACEWLRLRAPRGAVPRAGA